MSTGSAAHNASTIALTRAAASSPPSGNHMARDSTERYATNADSRGRTTSPSPKRLGAVPDRMRAPDGQNAGGRRELKAASARRQERRRVVVGLLRRRRIGRRAGARRCRGIMGCGIPRRRGCLLLALLRGRARGRVRLGGVLFLALVGSAVLVLVRVTVAGRIVRGTRPVMLRPKIEIRDHRERDLGHRRGRSQRRQTPCDDKGCHDWRFAGSNHRALHLHEPPPMPWRSAFELCPNHSISKMTLAAGGDDGNNFSYANPG